MVNRLVIALVTLIGLTGAGVVSAYLVLFAAGTDRVARLVPANTVAYVTAYLQPAPGQQMHLAQLLGRFPGFADEAALDAKVDQLVQNLLAQLGFDYREGIKPWLGDQLAFAWVPIGGELPAGSPVIIAEVKDGELAATSYAHAMSGWQFTTRRHGDVDLHDGGLAGYAIVDDMLLIGPPQALEAMIDVRNGADALAGRGDFQSTMAGLPADHLASGFLDVAGLAGIAGVDESEVGVPAAGAVLVAERDGLRLTGSGAFANGGGSVDERPSSLVGWMPADTVVEASVFGLRDTLLDAEDAVAGVDEAQDTLAAFDLLRAAAALGLGVDLDSDVLSLLDGEAAVALSGFDGELFSGQVLLRPRDADAGADAIDRLLEGLASVGTLTSTTRLGSATLTTLTIPEMGDVTYTTSDGVIIIGLSDADDVEAALEAHESAGSLADGGDYARAFALAGSHAGNEAWADAQALLGLLGPLWDGIPTNDDVRDMLGQLGTVGLTMPSHENHIDFHVVLTVE